jgi:hypothetical protein
MVAVTGNECLHNTQGVGADQKVFVVGNKY